MADPQRFRPKIGRSRENLRTDRVYVLPFWRMAVGYVGLTFIVALWFVPLADPSSVNRWVYLILGPGAVVFLAFAFRALAHNRTVEKADGMHTHSFLGLGSKFLPWSEIASFRATSRIVSAVDHQGRATPLVGIDARAAATRWKGGGQTDDIIGELNSRLALRKSAQRTLTDPDT